MPNNRFTEAMAAKVVRQSLQALNYLHGLGIVHRDLKTENIMFVKDKKFVKLIDFGFANFYQNVSSTNEDDGGSLHETKGTPYFISPEVFRGTYDKRCDLWSMGVVTFFLLSGTYPFLAPNPEELQVKILSCDYDFDEQRW